LEFAEEEEKVSMRLRKKRGEQEWWRVSLFCSHGSNSQAVADSLKLVISGYPAFWRRTVMMFEDVALHDPPPRLPDPFSFS